MPTYNPTDSRFLTLAQTRTNNGTRDVKLILDTIDKVFYTLDDDGVFDAVDNETAATIVTLSVGTLEGEGANPITIASDFVAGDNKVSLTNERIELGATLNDEGTLYDTNIRIEYSNITNTADGAYNIFVNGLGENSGKTATFEMVNDPYLQITLADTDKGDSVGRLDITADGCSIQGGPLDGSFTALVAANPYTNGATLEFQSPTSYALNYSTEIASGMYYNYNSGEKLAQVLTEETKTKLLYQFGELTTEIIELELNNGGVKITNLPTAADNADAISNGVPEYHLYVTDGNGASPLDVAGIVMMRLP